MLVLHDGIWKEWALVCLESLSGGNSLLPASIFASPFATIYRRVNLAFFLLSSSVGHCSFWSIVSTDEVLWYLFVTYLADLLCIISSLFMSLLNMRAQRMSETSYHFNIVPLQYRTILGDFVPHIHYIGKFIQVLSTC